MSLQTIKTIVWEFLFDNDYTTQFWVKDSIMGATTGIVAVQTAATHIADCFAAEGLAAMAQQTEVRNDTLLQQLQHLQLQCVVHDIVVAHGYPQKVAPNGYPPQKTPAALFRQRLLAQTTTAKVLQFGYKSCPPGSVAKNQLHRMSFRSPNLLEQLQRLLKTIKAY